MASGIVADPGAIAVCLFVFICGVLLNCNYFDCLLVKHLSRYNSTDDAVEFVFFDVLSNCLESLPEWLSECVFLQKVSASKNFITYLPRGFVCRYTKLRIGGVPTDNGNSDKIYI